MVISIEYFFHDYEWTRHIAIMEYPGDSNTVMSAWLHIWTDKLCSEDPEFRKLMELRALVAKRQRKQEKLLHMQLLKERD